MRKWFVYIAAASGTDFHVNREQLGDVSAWDFSPGHLKDPRGVL